jgi:hypothetical protein
MKKVVIVIASIVAVLAALLVVGDRAAVAVAQNQVTEAVERELPGATGVSTTIHGFPAVTQVIGGSLDHVTVTASDVASEAGTVDSVVVDLYGVSTGTPRTADTVDASAVVPLSTLQAQLGDGWEISVEGQSLRAKSTGALPVEATVVPTVTDGQVGVEFQTFTLLGVEVAADKVPEFVTTALKGMIGDVSTDLPFGLAPTSVEVVPEGVAVSAKGTDVPLQ